MKADLSIVFEDEPKQWGLRGDQYLWAELREECIGKEIPIKEDEIVRMVCKKFESVSGVPLTYDARPYVEKYAHVASLKEIAEKFNKKFGEGVVKLELKHSYSNMLQIIEKNPKVLIRARTAIESVGIPAVSDPVRGGTDGAKLSFMGLPCPNLGTGGAAFHGPYEHTSAENLDAAARLVEAVIDLAR